MCGQWGSGTLGAQPAHVARARSSQQKAAAPRHNPVSACAHQERFPLVAGGSSECPQSVSDHFYSKEFKFAQGKRSPALNLPSIWHTSFWTQMVSSDHKAFDKNIYLIFFFFFAYTRAYICIYMHTYHTSMWLMPPARTEGLKDTQLFASIGENMI